jgi:hypothetical protein
LTAYISEQGVFLKRTSISGVYQFGMPSIFKEEIWSSMASLIIFGWGGGELFSIFAL